MRLPWQKEQSGGGMILPRGWKRNIARQRVFAACSPTSSARILSPPGAVSLSSRARSSRTGGRAGKDEQAQTARPRNAQAAARRASPWPPPAPSGRPSPPPAAGARGTRRHARPAVALEGVDGASRTTASSSRPTMRTAAGGWSGSATRRLPRLRCSCSVGGPTGSASAARGSGCSE
jgi:hypothetical protein